MLLGLSDLIQRHTHILRRLDLPQGGPINREPSMTQDEEVDFLAEVLKGNQNAVNFLLTLFQISQAWDDIVDGDKHVATDKALFNAVIVLPANLFYQKHFNQLHPILQTAAYDWLAANVLEKGTTHDRTLAFVLRDSLTAIVQQCAYIVGGHEWAIHPLQRERRSTGTSTSTA